MLYRGKEAGEISPKAFHCATASDGSNCQWKAGEFERVEAENRTALKAADEAAIEANGYFTDPDWREVVSPDGVKVLRHQLCRAGKTSTGLTASFDGRSIDPRIS